MSKIIHSEIKKNIHTYLLKNFFLINSNTTSSSIDFLIDRFDLITLSFIR